MPKIDLQKIKPIMQDFMYEFCRVQPQYFINSLKGIQIEGQSDAEKTSRQDAAMLRIVILLIITGVFVGIDSVINGAFSAALMIVIWCGIGIPFIYILVLSILATMVKQQGSDDTPNEPPTEL